MGASFSHNHFDYDLTNTLNASLGPCLTLDPAVCSDPAPGPDGTPGTGDEIPNQTSFYAGRLLREELITQANVTKSLNLGLRAPVHLALGAAFRRERYRIEAGELASYINGNDSTQFGGGFGSSVAGSQGFPGFSPSDTSGNHRTNVAAYADAETDLASPLLADVAGRFEHYSDFGSRMTGKLALRYQPTKQITLQGAASTGFRAPGISQEFFSKLVTNVISGVPVQVGIFPVGARASQVLGAKPLRDETSVNLSGGLAVSPSSNFTLTADYFYIKINHRIMLSATFLQDSTLRILADSGVSGVGGVQYFTNGLDTRTEGVDFTANLRLPAVGAGTLDLTAGVNWTQNKITHVDPLPPIFNGTGETGIIDTVTYLAVTEERPDWRGTFTAQYSVSRLHSLARASYYGKFSSAQPGYGATDRPIVISRAGISPIGASPTACSNPTKNQTASPAITAVLGPAPNRGRMAAYTHSRPMPYTKSSSTRATTPLSIAAGLLPSACIAAARSGLSQTPYTSQSTTFSTTPASSPPTTTLPQLIFPIAHLGERVPLH